MELHGKLKEDIMHLQAVQSQWTETVDEAFRLEELIASQKNEKPPNGLTFMQSIKWRYRVHGEPIFARILSVFCALLSVLMVWSEVTMLFTKNLSPLSLLILSVRYAYRPASCTSRVPPSCAHVPVVLLCDSSLLIQQRRRCSTVFLSAAAVLSPDL